jgi:hypothetical protein
MPMRTDVPTAYPAYFNSHPEYTIFAEQAARTVEVPNVPNSVEIWQTFRDAYSQAVIFGSLPSDSWLVANLRKSHAVARFLQLKYQPRPGRGLRGPKRDLTIYTSIPGVMEALVVIRRVWLLTGFHARSSRRMILA